MRKLTILFIMVSFVAGLGFGQHDSITTEQDYQTPSQYRYSITGKLLGEIRDSNLFYSLFKDLDIFEKDKKFLWIDPDVEMFKSVTVHPASISESESPPGIEITYDMSYLYGEAYIFKFYAEYEYSSVSNTLAELKYIQDGKLATRTLSWSNDAGGDNEIKFIAERIYRWWKRLAERGIME